MTLNLAKTLEELVGREGGYSNNPADRGGETMWGITLAVARAFGYLGAMRDMPRETALEIYRQRYWVQPRFDQVAQISPVIAEELLDTGVNMGTGIAGRFLQRALNALNQQGKIYPDLTVDGAIGQMTLYALRTHLAARGDSGAVVLLRMLNAQQSVRYIELAEATPSQEQFEFGWQRARVT